MDIGDAEAFLAAAIGIFAEFPPEVGEIVSDPVRGLPSRVRRPHLVDVRKACEEAYEPIERRLLRERAMLDQKRLRAPPPPEPKMTKEEMEAKWGAPLFKRGTEYFPK